MPNAPDPVAKAEKYIDAHVNLFEAGSGWEPTLGATGLLFDPIAVTRLGESALVAAKKAALFGKHSYFLTPFTATKFNLGGEEDSAGVPPMVLKWDPKFAEFLGPLLPFVADGCMDVLPKWEVGGADWGYLSYHTTYHGVLNIGVTKDYLVEQLTESAGAVRLMLPHLSGVSAERIVEVRNAEKSALTEFHQALARMSTAATDDEDTLYEWMKITDENIRRLNSTMKSIAKKRKAKGVAAVVSPFPLILGFAARPPYREIVEAAMTMLGPTSFLSSVKSIRELEDVKKQNIEQSPFYVPWLLQDDA